MGKSFCGGSLVNSWTVVTAAHCVHAGKGGGFLQERFSLGFGFKYSKGKKSEIKEEDSKFGTQIINIDIREEKNGEKGIIIVHPDYPGSVPDYATNVHSPNDIALIILPEEVQLPENSDAGLWFDDNTWDERQKPIKTRSLFPWEQKHQLESNDWDYLWLSGF